MKVLQAGVARTTIIPPLGMYLIGYADRSSGCTSVHDDLTVTALALDDGTQTLVILAVDMLALNEQIVARVRTGITDQWRIPGGQVMICCSHTHSGPIAYADAGRKRRDRRFLDSLVGRLVVTAGEALAEQVPATLAWGRGEVDIAVNRRQVLPDGQVIIGVNAEGAVDRSLLVVQVGRVEDGQPLATLVNVACHATVLGPKNSVVSADWPGAMRHEVEAAIGGHCLFLQGAAGNLNPDHEWGDDDLAAMGQLGHHVAGEVLKVAEKLEPFPASPLRAGSELAWLPIVPRTRPDGAHPLTYREVLAREARVPRFLVDTILNARYPWHTTLEQRDGQWHTPMEIQAFRLGDCAIIALAAETFNEIGTAIKDGSPAPFNLFAGCSNGCVGYLPTAAAHALGGYEVELTPYIYRMPGVLDPGCEELATRRSAELLRSLWDHGEIDDLG